MSKSKKEYRAYIIATAKPTEQKEAKKHTETLAVVSITRKK